MEDPIKDEYRYLCRRCLLKGNTEEGECMCMTCKSRLCHTCSKNHTCRKQSIESATTCTYLTSTDSDITHIQGQGHVRPPILKRPSGSIKGSVKMFGCRLDNSRVLMMRCAVHTEHRIENYCTRHDSVCCYKCVTASHDNCNILPLYEMSTRTSDSCHRMEQYKELKDLQSRIFDSSHNLYNEISNIGHVAADSANCLKEKYLKDQTPVGQNLHISRLCELCRETEDSIVVTVQTLRCHIDRKGDITAFVAYMKNKQRLVKLVDEISIALAEIIIDNGTAEQSTDRDMDAYDAQRVESKLEELLNLLEEFIKLLKGPSPSRQHEHNGDEDTQVAKVQIQSYHEPVLSDITEKQIHAESEQTNQEPTEPPEGTQCFPPTKLERNVQEGVLQETYLPLVLDPEKVTRNSTKSGYGKRHRIIRHKDTEMYFADEPKDESQNTEGTHIEKQATSEIKETVPDDTQSYDTVDGDANHTEPMASKTDEITHEKNKSPIENRRSIFKSPQNWRREKTTSSIDLKEILISRESTTIVCDVTADGSVITSGRNSVKRPLSNDIVLSTNRIRTKAVNPPGFHSQSIQVQSRLKLERIGELRVRIPEDSLPCDVNDIACMPDGKIVVSDFSNARLKLFYNGGRNVYWLDMQFPAHSVACVSNLLLVFAYGHGKNKLAITNVTNELRVREKFTTEHACVALAANNSFIYVLCKIEPRSEIHILNTEGVVNMKIDLGIEMLAPRCISVEPNSEMIYISDSRGISGVDRSGRKMVRISDSPISGYAGVATDSCGNVFVCTEFPDGVYAKPRGKSYLKPLLLGRGVRKVRAVCFSELNNSLVLSFTGSDYVRQYKIMSD